MLSAIAAKLGLPQLAARIILVLSLALAFIGWSGGVYLKGSSDRAAIIEAAQAKKALIAVEQDRKMALDNLNAAAEASAKVKEIGVYVDSHPQRRSECLSGADTERLRSLWK